MKKLICLLIMMIVAQAASASQVRFSTVDTWFIGQVITVDVIADIDAYGLHIGAIAVDKGDVSIGTLNPLFNIFNQQGLWKDDSVNNICIFQINATTDVGTFIEAGSVLYSFEIDTADLGVGDVITISEWTGINPFFDLPFPVSTYLNSQQVTFDSVAVSETPEPVTIALLGLGGLFIGRRK